MVSLICTPALRKKISIISTLFLLVLSFSAYAQPRITSVTPLTGKPGDTITIVGSGFAGTVALTDVYFGNARVTTYRSASTTTLRVIVPVGATYGPILVFDKLNTKYGTSKQFFSPTFAKPKGSFAVGDMTVSGMFATGTNPYSVAIGDVDGDGKPDAVVVNYTAKTVSVLRNTSTVGNVSFADTVNYATGVNPMAVALADMDNDQKLDIIVVNNGSNNVSVYKNTSTTVGTISFATRVNAATGNTGAAPNALAIADINGDGFQDIVATNGGTNTVAYLQNTSTTTAISFAIRLTFTTGTMPQGVAIADLDGNGALDLVVANNSDNTISVLQNNTTGSVSFAAKVDYNVGTAPQSVAMGDIDGDGKLDVIAANYTTGTISTLRNITGTVLTLNTAVNTTATSFPETIGITDIDADGKVDVVFANNASSFSVMKNKTTSTSPLYQVAVNFTTGSLTKAHAMGDIDGDGKLDAVVITNFNNAIVVVRNTPAYSNNADLSALTLTTGALSPTFATSTTSYSASVSNATTSITVTPTKAQDSAKLEIQLNGGIYTAINSGTASSPLSLVLGENTINIRVTAQDGTTIKVYSIIVTRAAPPTITAISPTNGAVGTTVTLTGTFFSSTLANNIVYFGATKATVTAATSTSLTVTVPQGATHAPITVLNTTSGLSGASRNYFNTTFKPNKGSIDTTDMTATNAFATNSAPYNVAVGDIDGDGKADEVVVDYSNAKFSVYRNTSTSGNVNFASKVDFTTLPNAQSVTLGDINNDGKLDVIVVHFMDSVSIFRNTSTSGNISFATRVNVLAGLAISVFSKCVVGDINNDGKNDIILNNTGQYQINVLRNTSTSSTNISFAFFSTFATGNNPTSLAIGDIDNDGKADIVTANANPANATGTAYYVVSVLKNISTTTTVAFATKSDFTVDGKPSYVALADINGDGTNDIVTGNSSTNNVSVLINYSTPGVLAMSTTNNFSTGVNANSLGIADIDGDGKLDIAVSSVKTGIRVLRNTSTSTSVNNLSFAPPVSIGTGYVYEDIATGDMDGDGKTDISAIGYFAPVLVVLRNTPILSSNNNLLSLSVSSGTLTPAFDSLATYYTVNVRNNITSINIIAIKSQDSAKIEIQNNGGSYSTLGSGVASSPLALNVGMNTIIVKVTAQNGSIKFYAVIVNRACLAPSSTTNLSICSNQLPYLWNGLTFTTAGTKSTILTTADGCDSSVTLNLSLKATSTSTTTLSACDSLNWNGTWYKQSGLYTYTTANSVGCDSFARVNLTIKKSTTSWTDVVNCDSTFWNGKWYSKSGFYTIHLTNKAGCDSAASLNLTVNDKPNGVFSSGTFGNLCAPDSVLIFFDVLSRSKQYLKIISPVDTSFEIGTANFGADIKTVPLGGNSFVYLPSSSPNNQACSTTFATGLFSGKVVVIDRGTCTFAAKAKAVQDAGAAGIIIVNNVAGASAMSMAGVDPTITIPVISVSQADGQILKNWISANQFTNGYTVTHTPTYLWSNGKTTASIKVTPTQTTTYSVNVTYENGCSQIFYFAVIIPKSSTSTTTVSVCDSLFWNGVTYKTSGIYTFKTTNSEGCDSTATLNLTITKTPNAGTISGANSFCFIGGSTTLTSDGDAGGIWSSNNSNRVSVNSAGKVTASMGGNYIIYYTVTNSCGSSTASFNIKVNVPSQSVLSVTACGSYTWNGTTYTKTGLYNKTGMTTVGGCDSTASLDLIINPLPVISNVIANPSTICAGSSSVLTVTGSGGLVTSGSPTDYWFNSPITFNNTSSQMLPNAVEYTKINVTTTSTINSLWVELWQNAPSGITCKMAIYTNDATTGKPQILIQETDPVISNTVSKLISGRNQFTLNPTLILQPGTYWVAAIWQGGNLPIKQFTGSAVTSYYTLRNYSLGFPTSLTSAQTTSEGFVVGIGLRATAMADATASYTWFPSSTLSSSTGVSVTATPPTTRTYIVSATNAFNCNTNSTVSVTVKSTSTSTTNLSVCDSVIWNNVTYKQSGVYTYKTVNAVGCDSTATLNLTIKKATTSTTNLTVCDSVIWNNITYKQSGVYTFKTSNAVGCDSTATLNLTIKKATSSIIQLTICQSLLPYTINGLTFTEEGKQSITLINANGCDSIVTYSLSSVKDGILSNATITQPKCDSLFGSISASYYDYTRVFRGTIDSTDQKQIGRLNVTAQPTSSCSKSSTNPGLVASDIKPRFYESYTLTNTTGATACISVNLKNYNPSNTYTIAAYNGSFNAINPSQNYLAHLGHSLGLGNDYFYFSIPANATFEIVVSNYFTGNFFGDYILEVSGLETPEFSINNGLNWQSSNNFNTVPIGNSNLIMRSKGTHCSTSYFNNPIAIKGKASTISTTNLSVCDSVIWNNTTYKTSGVYTFKTTNAVGCDSTATLNLTIKKATNSTTNLSVCDSVIWNNTTYKTSGVYTFKTSNTVGCDSTATLNLTIKKATTSTINLSVCDSVIWNNTTYKTSGVYTFKTTNTLGCDSTATLNLTIKKATTSTINLSVCDSVIWNNTTYKTSGVYTYKTTNAVGCDSTATLNLTIKKATTSITNLSVCDSVIWNNITYKTSGVYNFKTTNTVGCDSTATLNLTIKKATTSTTNLSVCDSVIWNNTTYRTSGVYTFKTTSAVGCDSTATLNLTIKKATTSTTNLSVCDSVIWNNTTYKTSGVYTYKTTNALGCDSTATLNLTIKKATTSTTNLSVCDSVIWNNTTYKTSGVYTYKTTNALGCDSTATLNLTIKKATTSTTNLSVCDSVIWNNTTYKTSGVYTYKTTNAMGCDSTATLNLTIKKATASTTSLSVCDSVIWNNTTYKTSGVYTFKTTNTLGCDSTATLNLTIKKATTSTTNLSVCDSVIWNNTTYKTSGVYTFKTTNTLGCDSTATLNLTIKKATTSTTNLYVCDSVIWNNTTYKTSGVYTFKTTNAVGCDSIATLNLTIKAVTKTITQQDFFGCNSYVFNGKTYTSSTIIKDTLKTTFGCDSIYRTFNINIQNIVASSQNINVNGCGSYLYKNNTYYTNTLVKDTLRTTQGCDSIYLTVNITVDPIVSGRILTPNKSAINNVQLNIFNSGLTTLNVNSSYASGCLNANNNVILKPLKNNDVVKANGVTSVDVLLTQRHILNTTKLNSPYKIIAADVDGNKTVNSVDILRMKRLILGTDTTFTKTVGTVKTDRLWEFVDSGYMFADTTNPFPFKDSILLSNITSNKINQTFIGVKLGDVNYDWNPTISRGFAANSLQLIANSEKKESVIHYNFTSSNFNNINALQTTLHFDNTKYEFIGIENGKLQLDYNASKSNTTGNIALLWTDKNAEAKSFDKDEVLFTVILKPISAGISNLELVVSNDMVETEAWDNNFTKRNIVLKQTLINDKQQTPNHLLIYPNPAHTTVGVKLDKLTGAATLIIADVYGKQVLKKVMNQSATTIDIAGFTKGVYMISVITEQGKQTQKLVVE